MEKSKGFTLIELIVVLAIISVLSGVILFTITKYLDKGKDSNVSGSLAILIPAGENYYTNNNNSYGSSISSSNFCDPKSGALNNAISQMPDNPISGGCYGGTRSDPSSWKYNSNPAGVCCYTALLGQSWVACAREFADPTKAFCVDSRGMKKEIDAVKCINMSSTLCTLFNGTCACP